MNDSELLEFWYKALRSEDGIKVRTNNVTAVRARMYLLRRQAEDPRLDALSIYISPDFPNELWITKRTITDLEEALKNV